VSDCLRAFGERRGDPQPVAGVDAEFVVAAAQVLDEGIAGDHHRCRQVGAWSRYLRSAAGSALHSTGRRNGVPHSQLGAAAHLSRCLA
jgi:hypothetical protein